MKLTISNVASVNKCVEETCPCGDGYPAVNGSARNFHKQNEAQTIEKLKKKKKKESLALTVRGGTFC